MNDPSDQKPDAEPFGSSALAIIRALGRALIGAFAGLVMVGLTLLIASDYFRLITFKDPATHDSFFRTAIGVGAAAFAFIAVVSGGAEIRGRAGLVIQGVLAGTAAGVVAGGVFGPVLGSKGGGILGIFVGGPLGAIIGGMIGAEAGKDPGEAPAAKGKTPPDDLS
jgi:hypothetical protein